MVPPPPLGWKFNCDAACRGNQAFLAVVCRDSCGRLTSAWTDTSLSSNPLLAELSAAFLACSSIPSSCDGTVIIEGDSLIACQLVHEQLDLDMQGPV
ncbi:hypothetical protein CJ030_MR1G028902 [Morella rubra]|uniref:RNase H type-1 domain-containing protein n=1 Tax=Morella rubra TaxID=262757 RepID=A0A6A1WR31_9ROSI|nr:hypothetical protein CJ030_MR1G028902 [Morella rubra]